MKRVRLSHIHWRWKSTCLCPFSWGLIYEFFATRPRTRAKKKGHENYPRRLWELWLKGKWEALLNEEADTTIHQGVIFTSTSVPQPLATGAADVETLPSVPQKAIAGSHCCYEIIKQNCARRPEAKQKQMKHLAVGTSNDSCLSRETLPGKINQMPFRHRLTQIQEAPQLLPMSTH